MKFTRLTVSAAVLVCGLALAGCGKKPDDGIATAGNGGTEQKPAAVEVATDPQERARQFAKCMRENGVDMPDPEFGEDGGIKVRIGGTGVAPGEVPDRAKLEQARQACRQFLPSGGDLAKPDPQMQAKLRDFAKCMRDNGVENFPDPSAEGGIMIGRPGSGLDPSDPVFQAAQEKCQEFMPFKRQVKVESK